MSRTYRIHQIDQMLNNRHHVTIPDFLDALEVSLATFKRDLEFMRDQLNAPIIWDRELSAYRLDATPDNCRYQLPGLWLNAGEAHALLTLHQLLEQLEPGLLGQHIAPIRQRLVGLLQGEGLDPDTLSRRVRLLQPMKRHAALDGFERIARATLDRQRLRLQHFNRNTGERTAREVSPQRLTCYRDNWYLEAWCHSREAIRSFALDAIESAELLSESAIELDDAQLAEVLGTGFGMFNGRDVQWAELVFAPLRASWVSRQVWHSEQIGELLPDGRFRVRIPYTDDRELVNEILSYMPDVAVVGPPALAQRVTDVLRAGISAQINSGSPHELKAN